jgi:hypothetical protein
MPNRWYGYDIIRDRGASVVHNLTYKPPIGSQVTNSIIYTYIVYVGRPES